MKYIILLIFLTSCLVVPHWPATPRTPDTATKATVIVESICADGVDPFHPTAWNRKIRRGTGVIISERYVLTVAHNVKCAVIPTVRVYITGTDNVFLMEVVRDGSFEKRGQDLAKLEIATLERFHVDVPPPYLAPDSKDEYDDENFCISSLRQISCGTANNMFAKNYTDVPVDFNIMSLPGDSGSATYDNIGRLIGLVQKGGKQDNGAGFTHIERVTPDWLRD